MAADLPARALYVAWKIGDGTPPEVCPAAEDWPEPFQDNLEAWMAQW